MDELIERYVEDHEAFVVAWMKSFTKGQLREARKRLPFSVTARTVENQLAEIELKMGGFLQHDASKGLTQTRFTLLTQSGDKGMDITIAEDVSGMFGAGYYHQPTTQRRDAWMRVGSAVMGLINRKLDTRAAEALIAQYGQDAFKDTGIDLFCEGQPLGIPNMVFYKDNEFGQMVQDLVNAYQGTIVEVMPTAEITASLDYTERKIKDAYDRLVSEGQLSPTDEVLAARLPIGPRGKAYTRETVNRYRNKMRRRGIEV